MAKVSIEDELYLAYKEAAAALDRATDDFIAEALRDWLAEFQEDMQLAEERLAEYERTGNAVDLEQVLRERGLKCG